MISICVGVYFSIFHSIWKSRLKEQITVEYMEIGRPVLSFSHVEEPGRSCQRNISPINIDHKGQLVYIILNDILEIKSD